MTTQPIVLASASPRRRRLIQWLGVPVDAVATGTAEDLSSPLKAAPPVLARSLAADKARAARALPGGESAVILAFDTIVVLDRAIMGKPTDEADARRMLAALSGRTHQVVTGIAVMRPENTEPWTFAVTTDVDMRELDEATVDAWLAGDEALGCAGAYNIERHLGSVGEGGCFQNVAGLPLCHLYQRLQRIGVEGLTSPIAACEDALGRPCPLGPRACVTPGL
jgi:septum formation protein